MELWSRMKVDKLDKMVQISLFLSLVKGQMSGQLCSFVEVCSRDSFVPLSNVCLRDKMADFLLGPFANNYIISKKSPFCELLFQVQNLRYLLGPLVQVFKGTKWRKFA